MTNVKLMVAEDLMSADTTAIKELKSLYTYFYLCSDAALDHATGMKVMGHPPKNRTNFLAQSEAYGWAADDIAKAILKLGHKLPKVSAK